MYKYSKKSRKELNSCDYRLIEIFEEVIKIYDCSILQGYRSNEQQQKEFEEGDSQLQAGESTHNTKPSRGVDVAPYPIDWGNTDRFAELAGIVKGIAHMKGYKITWGGDWKSLRDMPHFQVED